jgi:hypothetical protein
MTIERSPKIIHITYNNSTTGLKLFYPSDCIFWFVEAAMEVNNVILSNVVVGYWLL